MRNKTSEPGWGSQLPKIWSIAFYAFRAQLRNPATFAFGFIFPIVFISVFGLMSSGNTIKVNVPIRFEGTAPGVRAGGKFIQKLRSVKIKTKPELMVDEMKVDISKLKLGQSLRVRDITTREGVEIINAQALPIASVVIPRGLKGDAEEEEETAAAATAEAGEATAAE